MKVARMLCAALVAVLLFLTVGAVTAQADSDHVTICHATGGANGDSFVSISPSASGVFHGHLSHEGGRDIIPPFEYAGVTYSQNWPSGQLTFDNGCVAPNTIPPPSPPPTPPPTVTVTVPYRIGVRMCDVCPFTEKGSFTAVAGDTVTVVITRASTGLGFAIKVNGAFTNIYGDFVARSSRTTLRVTVGSIDVKELARRPNRAAQVRTYSTVV